MHEHLDHREDRPLDLAELTELATRLQAAQARLEEQVTPTRRRLVALGPAGLFALAAAEQQQADSQADRHLRRMHVIAANAAQRLGEQLAGERADA